jgi:hypothetical protein
VQYDKPIYLSVDASQVGIGCFVYQIDRYERNKENEEKFLKELGFIPENKHVVHLLPGVSPGKNTPTVTTYLTDENSITSYDCPETFDPMKTMTQKIQELEKYIFHVRPIQFYSKLFTQSQILRYHSMEKEFVGLVHTVIHFRDLIMSCPVAFVLSDSQPVLWALKHKDESVRLTRYLLKLFEYPLNFICVHLEGSKNAVSDYLLRIAIVDETKPRNNLGYRDAQHVFPTFPPMTVLTKDDIVNAFNQKPNIVTPCKDPQTCTGNVNAQLYRGLGPFSYKPTCVAENKKISNYMENLMVTQQELADALSDINIYKKQCEDDQCQKIIEYIKKGKFSNYFLD